MDYKNDARPNMFRLKWESKVLKCQSLTYLVNQSGIQKYSYNILIIVIHIFYVKQCVVCLLKQSDNVRKNKQNNTVFCWSTIKKTMNFSYLKKIEDGVIRILPCYFDQE